MKASREGTDDSEESGCIVPLKKIEYCLGYNIIRSAYTPYSIY